MSSRLANDRYLSLDALMVSVKGRAERSRIQTGKNAAVRVEAGRDHTERLDVILRSAGSRAAEKILRRLSKFEKSPLSVTAISRSLALSRDVIWNLLEM
ncbi:hypothetical protein [Blastomonas sp. UPD001]|uniref:hypothetical protein n=1 Tax=Blastomonas sp. UPD001 TaxID=2217673 RepID=UPI0013004621|nr:hypothetical protein [Blastomonas sp. UPD001]